MRLKKAETEFVALARVCRVATLEDAGRSHCVPVCPVFDGKLLYFASDKNARKIKNIERNPGVTLEFDDYSEAWSGLRGVVIQGEGKIVSNGRLFRKIRGLLYTKFPQYEEESPIEDRDSAIVEVTPARAFSWGLS